MRERDPGIPYYARHSVRELTCPHCKGMVTFISNMGAWGEYLCKCGKWTQYAVWGIYKQRPRWEYVAKEAVPCPLEDIDGEKQSAGIAVRSKP